MVATSPPTWKSPEILERSEKSFCVLLVVYYHDSVGNRISIAFLGCTENAG